MNHDNLSLLDNTNLETVSESGYESIVETRKVPAQFVEQGTPKKLPQYVAAFAASLSALASGMVLAWTSPIQEDLAHGNLRNITLSADEIGWVGSFVSLGAMIMCIPVGFMCDLVGCKKTLLMLIIPFTTGWLLILFATNVLMFYFGRIITGMATGACCVAVPIYCTEIAHKSLRGTLTSFFQLMVTVGILLCYVLGKYLTPINLTISCLCSAFVFILVFAPQPQTPVYLIKKGLYEQAKLSLIKLRGQSYNVDSELNDIEGDLKARTRATVSLTQAMRKKSIVKAFIISFALYFFQQFSGINPVILYTTDILSSSGTNKDTKTPTIIAGAIQVIGTFASTMIIDKSGRRILLLVSSLVIVISTLQLAIYTTFSDRMHDHSSLLANLGFVPVVSVCILLLAFSLGLGPIPWVIAAEIFPTEIQSVMTSLGGTFNWFLAFLLTKFYLSISATVGKDTTFYIFSVVSLIGTVFIYVVLPETKGKTIQEIQDDLEK